ncbi:hypothetical protein D9M70_266950 [compost metagenome]
MEQCIEVALVVEHQAQIDLRLRLEVLVDGAFADTHCVGDHLDGNAVFALFQEEFEGGVENFLLAAAELTDFTGFFLHKGTVGSKIKPRIMPIWRKNARNIQL